MTTRKPEPVTFTVIDTYSRQDAIANGDLIDVGHTAREAGFRIPVAITHAAWHGYIAPPPDLDAYGQSETGRLWDVLTVLHATIRAQRRTGDTVLFTVAFQMTPGRMEHIRLKSICGPGDDAQPVLTIMLPDED